MMTIGFLFVYRKTTGNARGSKEAEAYEKKPPMIE